MTTLTTEQRAALAALIDGQAGGSPIATAKAAGNDAEVARLLNTTSSSTTLYKVLYRADILKVIVLYGAGAAIDAAVTSNPAAWATSVLVRDSYSELDINDAQVRSLTQGLNGLGTPPEGYPGLGDAIIGSAAYTASLSESLLGRGGSLTADDVAAAYGRI